MRRPRGARAAWDRVLPAAAQQTARRSSEATISAEIPQRVGSNPAGIWPPTVRVSSTRRGTRTSVPARRVTVQSVEPGTGAMTVPAPSAAAKARASAAPPTVKVHILFEEHRRRQGRGGVAQRALVLVAADSRARQHDVVEKVGDLGSPVPVSYQPGAGSFSQVTGPVVQASSRTPAADRRSETSISTGPAYRHGSPETGPMSG